MRAVAAALVLCASLAIASSAIAAGDEPYVCQPGQVCVSGPEYEFPTFGNTPPTSVGDCTFAAAADWIEATQGVEPEPAGVIEDFFYAGGSWSHGLSQAKLWSYWREEGGIAGYRLVGLSRLAAGRGDLENAVVDDHALIAQLQWGSGWGFGATRQLRAGMHDVVVDGYTPVGPIAVTWGREVQMTWQQWSAEARGLWYPSVQAEP